MIPMDGKNTQQLSKRMIDFQSLLNQFLDIQRMIHLPDGKHKDRLETDTEHSYHLAMMGWYLCGAFPHLDKNKVIQYGLVHDLVEIYAGDVMAVGRTAEQEKLKDFKEAQALERLEQEWPDFSEMTKTIHTFESQTDPESVFVKALDKILPMVHNVMSTGKTWKKYNLDRKVIIDLKDNKTAPSPEITAIWQEFKKTIMDHPEFFNKGKAN